VKSLEQRLQQVEDRLAIADLQARYTIFIDNHDLEKVAPLFARDGRFRSADGMLNAQGRAEICEQYRARFAALRFGFHVTHDHMIDLDENNPDRATGKVSSHAELVRNGQAMVAGMRYEDEYIREDGAWRFADRLLYFFYYMPVADFAQGLTEQDRMRAYGDKRPAELPESIATFKAGN